jgi:hypothetical protein
MREKELRLALICYGGVSLAIYMHGVTREIWHMVRASRAFHDGAPPTRRSEIVYHDLLTEMSRVSGVKLRVPVASYRHGPVLGAVDRHVA